MKSNKALILSAISILLTPQIVHAADIPSNGDDISRLQTLEISTSKDLEMSCSDLSREATNMSSIIYATQDVKDASEMKSHGITAAGAVGSFLIGSVTGGIGLAVGGFLMNQGVEGRSDEADKLQDIAAQRRTLMMGLHNAKGCYGPIDHALHKRSKFDSIGNIAQSTENKYYSERRKRYND